MTFHNKNMSQERHGAGLKLKGNALDWFGIDFGIEMTNGASFVSVGSGITSEKS